MYHPANVLSKFARQSDLVTDSSWRRDPPLNRGCGVVRSGIKAKLGLRRVFMHDVDELFEQGRILGDQPDTGADQDAIISPLVHTRANHSPCRLAKISQAKVCVITERLRCASSAFRAAIIFDTFKPEAP
jgi:hypothetical protein